MKAILLTLAACTILSCAQTPSASETASKSPSQEAEAVIKEAWQRRFLQG